MGHAAAYSPLAKHRFEENSTKSVGPVYRYRNYWKPIVVVSDPVLQHEVKFLCFLLLPLTPGALMQHASELILSTQSWMPR